MIWFDEDNQAHNSIVGLVWKPANILIVNLERNNSREREQSWLDSTTFPQKYQ